MNNLPQHRPVRSWLTELSDAFTGLPTWVGMRPILADAKLIRLEEEVGNGHYLVRAELPGIDPAKDVDITVRDNQLTIKADRAERKESSGHTEFSYGSFMRTITLPSGANADEIKATYDKGILTVDVALPAEVETPVKHVMVEAAR